MKLITMALVCLLVAGMWLQDVNSRSLLVPTRKCCFEFVNDRTLFLRRTILCYRKPSPSCSHKEGIIFKMKKGREVCASNKEQWVQDYLLKLPSCRKP